jgi:hypothetical protein
MTDVLHASNVSAPRVPYTHSYGWQGTRHSLLLHSLMICHSATSELWGSGGGGGGKGRAPFLTSAADERHNGYFVAVRHLDDVCRFYFRVVSD